MTRFLRFFAVLIMALALTPVLAASEKETGDGGSKDDPGYNCPTIQKYTSCVNGRYLSDCGSVGNFLAGPITNPAVNNSCVSCPSGYTCAGGTACPQPTTTGTTCAAGTYWNGSACVTCTAGYRCPGFTNITNPSSGYGRYICTGATWSASGASVCTNCPTGYTANTISGKTANTACQISCAAGRIVQTPNAACTTPSGFSWYTDATHLVNYTQVSPLNRCMTGYDYYASSAVQSNHSTKAGCSKQIAANTYVPNGYLNARYVKVLSSGVPGYTTNYTYVVAIEAYDANTGVNRMSGKTGTGGTGYTNATNGNYANTNYATCYASGCVWNMGAIYPINEIRFALRSNGNAYSNLQILVSTDNSTWTTVLGGVSVPTSTNNSSFTPAINKLLLTAPEVACTSGQTSTSQLVTIQNTTTCGSSSSCVPGEFYMEKKDLCVLCPEGAYTNTYDAIECIPCQNGATTNGAGQTSCNAICTNNNGHVASWITAWWAEPEVYDICMINSCASGYNLVNNQCVEVTTPVCAAGEFYVSASNTCVQCATGSYPNEPLIPGGNPRSCVACQNGTTTTGPGQTSCNATCANAANVSSWYLATWSSNTVSNLCRLTGCDGGYCEHVRGICSAAGTSNWSAHDSYACAACPTGLTTIGYGLGADEEADCGMKLRYGDTGVLHLRSAPRTTPSLNVNVAGTVYYGNVWTACPTNSIRLNISGAYRCLCDDSSCINN